MNGTTNRKKLSIKNLTPRSTIITLIVLIVLITLGNLIYKNIFSTIQQEETIAAIETPSEAVQKFYTWYMSYRGNSIETGAYKTSPQLSSVFVNSIDNRIYQNQLPYDPFVCNVAKPFGVSVISEEIIDGSAKVLINTDYGEDRTVNINMVLEDKSWKIASIECPQIEELRKQEEDRYRNKVVLFLTNTSKNETDENGCGIVYAVERVVEEYTDPLTVALQELLKGTTRAEEILGYTSVFSAETEDMLGGIRISEDTVYISLRNYDEFVSSLTPCEAKSFKSQIEETIKYYTETNNFVYEE